MREPQTEQQESVRRIEVWREPDGLWQWLYREDGQTLLSNSSYDTRGDALRSARTAYPEVPVRERPAPRGPSRPSPAMRVRSTVVSLLLLVMIVVALAAVVLLALLGALVILLRRTARRGRMPGS